VEVFWQPEIADGVARYAKSKRIESGDVLAETIAGIALRLTELWA
jgi:hypothetical protein